MEDNTGIENKIATIFEGALIETSYTRMDMNDHELVRKHYSKELRIVISAVSWLLSNRFGFTYEVVAPIFDLSIKQISYYTTYPDAVTILTAERIWDKYLFIMSGQLFKEYVLSEKEFIYGKILENRKEGTHTLA